MAASTLETAERAGRYAIAACGNLEIDQLEYSHGEQFRNWMLKTGRKKTSANIYLRSLQAVLSWATEKGIFLPNPSESEYIKMMEVENGNEQA